MFSGLIESVQNIKKVTQGNGSMSLWISKPSNFHDLKVGDSISVNGLCLTLEEFDIDTMKFTLGAETLKLIGKTISLFSCRPVNLERSLKWGDRIHGHLVSGHVEALGEIVRSEALGDSWVFEIKCPSWIFSYIFSKGSIAVNGVSLTVNEIQNDILQVCLIPETIKKTNLNLFNVGDLINIETDYNVKSILKTFESHEIIKKISEQIRLTEKGLR